MSKYIPGNQKHFFVKILRPSQRKLDHGVFLTGTTKELSIMPKTFVYTAITVKKQTPVEKSFSAVSNAHPVQPATRPVRITKRKRCSRLDRAPYVCNGCPMKINHCTIAHKYRYDARFADRKYRELLSSSRAGINMTRHQLHQKNQIITPLIAQGQSPYQILINHP